MNWKLIWRGLKKTNLRKKLLAVFGILLVYRMLSHVPIPLEEPAVLKQVIDNLLNNEGVPVLLSQVNLLSGGALASLSIMLVGLGPYINASIIMQVLTKAIPKLETMQKEGEYGRKKINQYTRILTLPLAIIQSIFIIYIVLQFFPQLSGLGDIAANTTLTDWILVVTTLTAGAMILMWLGEQITERSIGNGISLLITVAIVSQLPYFGQSLYAGITDVDAGQSWSIFGWFSLPINSQFFWITFWLFLATFLLTVFVVYLNEAQRKITLSYAKKTQGNRTYSNVTTFLPLKLISAGVIPIIFALMFLSVPQLMGHLLSGAESETWSLWGDRLVTWFSPPGTVDQVGPLFGSWTSYIYPTTYFVLVVAFTYFYTSVVFNAKDISERLQRQGGFIANVRPGESTQKYLSAVVNRLNFFGALSLGFLALSPILAQAFLGVNQVVLGGTSLLILVSVALETLRQIESQARVVTYDDYERDFSKSQDVPEKRKFFTKRR